MDLNVSGQVFCLMLDDKPIGAAQFRMICLREIHMRL